MTGSFRDNTERHRFELDVNGEVAFANYRRDGSTLAITHVEAPLILRGTGAASRLMEHVVKAARAEELTIRPLCGYAAAWLRRHEKHPP